MVPPCTIACISYAHSVYQTLCSAGWFSSAAFMGGFSSAAQGGNTPAAATAAAKTWAFGVPLGLVLRSISKGYIPATAFLAVSMGVTAVLMIGWRAALAAVTPEVGQHGFQYCCCFFSCVSSIVWLLNHRRPRTTCSDRPGRCFVSCTKALQRHLSLQDVLPGVSVRHVKSAVYLPLVVSRGKTCTYSRSFLWSPHTGKQLSHLVCPAHKLVLVAVVLFNKLLFCS